MAILKECMINSVIIILIKNKCGDWNDKNNYRLMAMPSIMSKVLEHNIIISKRLEVYMQTIINLIILRSSTDLCIYDLTKFINTLKVVHLSIYMVSFP